MCVRRQWLRQALLSWDGGRLGRLPSCRRVPPRSRRRILANACSGDRRTLHNTQDVFAPFRRIRDHFEIAAPRRVERPCRLEYDADLPTDLVEGVHTVDRFVLQPPRTVSTRRPRMTMATDRIPSRNAPNRSDVWFPNWVLSDPPCPVHGIKIDNNILRRRRS